MQLYIAHLSNAEDVPSYYLSQKSLLTMLSYISHCQAVLTGLAGQTKGLTQDKVTSMLPSSFVHRYRTGLLLQPIITANVLRIQS